MVARKSYLTACEIFTVDDKIALVEVMKGCLCSKWIERVSCQDEQVRWLFRATTNTS